MQIILIRSRFSASGNRAIAAAKGRRLMTLVAVENHRPASPAVLFRPPSRSRISSMASGGAGGRHTLLPRSRGRTSY